MAASVFGVHAQDGAALGVEHQHGVAGDRERAGRAAEPDRRHPARGPSTADSRVRVPSPRLATQIEPKPTAMSCGSRPTGSRRPTTTCSRGSMRATVPSPEFTTQTWLAPIAQRGREVAGADRPAEHAVGDGVDARDGPRLAVAHPGAVRADGDVDRVRARCRSAARGRRGRAGSDA